MIIFTKLTRNRNFVVMEDFNFPRQNWRILLFSDVTPNLYSSVKIKINGGTRENEYKLLMNKPD